MKKIGIFFIAMLFLLAFQSCQKDTDIRDNDELLINQEAIAEQTMVDLDVLVDEVLGLQFTSLKSATTEGFYFVNGCPTITVNLTSTPKVMTIDFGQSCKGKDGKVRSGKIIVTSTTVENFSFERTKAFENFFVDGKKIEGTVTRKVTLNREDHSRVAKVKEDVTITFPDNGGKASRKSDITREYQLFVLGVPKDNVIKSWGSSEFTRATGLKITKTIAESDPLVFKMECHQNVSGVVSFKTSDNRTWSIDYGKGDCDNKAILTKDGETKEIKLGK